MKINRRNAPRNTADTPIRHPATEQRFQEAAQRWMDLKKSHDEMVRLLWLGIMVANFTDDEFALLRDYLCENDRRYLHKAGRRVEGE